VYAVWMQSADMYLLRDGDLSDSAESARRVCGMRVTQTMGLELARLISTY
jgi:hypothetical protein